MKSQVTNADKSRGMENGREDWSKQNPGLHHCYFVEACKHLKAIADAIALIDRFANANMSHIASVINSERYKLIKGNQAYTEAAELLQKLKAQPHLDYEASSTKEEEAGL